jgi:5-methylcytosine-specific restriction endonuclease McrA
MDFYNSIEWRAMRYRVLLHYGKSCMLCNARNVELHVDHIKPISRFPELKLSFDNLQVLCKDCNLGKSNTDQTDLRPEHLKNATPPKSPKIIRIKPSKYCYKSRSRRK